MRPLFNKSTEPVPVEAISGACMMVKRHTVEQIGGFSPEYFMYSEDMDLCLRAAKYDWRIYYIPNAAIVHHGSGSSSVRKETHFNSVMLRASVAHFLELHRGRGYAALYRLVLALVSGFRLVLLLLALPIAIAPAGYRFLVHAVGNWSGVLVWSIGGARWVGQHRTHTILPSGS